MTLASLSPDLQSPTQPTRSDSAFAQPDGRHTAVTLWLFGLTAMTLVFASVLLLALLARSGIVDSSITAALADERGALQPGDRVAFLGIGSGLNCVMLGVEW